MFSKEYCCRNETENKSKEEKVRKDSTLILFINNNTRRAMG